MLLVILLACHDKVSESSEPVDTTPPGPLLLGTASFPDDTPAAEALSLGVVRIVYGDGPLLETTLSVAPLNEDGRWAVELPQAAPEEHIGALSRMDTSLTGALYAIVAFYDADGDGAFTEGEPLRGASFDRMLLWLSGEPPEGYPLGWSVVDSGFAGQYEPNRCRLDTTEPLLWRSAQGYPVFYGLSDMVSMRLSGVEVGLHLAGSVPDAQDGVFGVVGLPYQAFSGGVSDRIYTVAVSGQRFEAQLDAPPPDTHYVGGDPDWAYTYHFNLLFRDLDQDQVFDYTEEVEGSTTCINDQPVYTRYTRPVHSWRGYRFLDCYGGTVGWRSVQIDPDSSAVRYLSAEESTSLVLDHDNCRLDGG